LEKKKIHSRFIYRKVEGIVRCWWDLFVKNIQPHSGVAEIPEGFNICNKRTKLKKESRRDSMFLNFVIVRTMSNDNKAKIFRQMLSCPTEMDRFDKKTAI